MALIEEAGLDFVDVCEAREHAVPELIARLGKAQRRAGEALAAWLSTIPPQNKMRALLEWQDATEQALRSWGLDYDAAHSLAGWTARMAL